MHCSQHSCIVRLLSFQIIKSAGTTVECKTRTASSFCRKLIALTSGANATEIAMHWSRKACTQPAGLTARMSTHSAYWAFQSQLVLDTEMSALSNAIARLLPRDNSIAGTIARQRGWIATDLAWQRLTVWRETWIAPWSATKSATHKDIMFKDSCNLTINISSENSSINLTKNHEIA